MQIFDVIIFFELRPIQQKTVKPTYLCPLGARKLSKRKKQKKKKKKLFTQNIISLANKILSPKRVIFSQKKEKFINKTSIKSAKEGAEKVIMCWANIVINSDKQLVKISNKTVQAAVREDIYTSFRCVLMNIPFCTPHLSSLQSGKCQVEMEESLSWSMSNHLGRTKAAHGMKVMRLTFPQLATDLKLPTK